MTRMKGVTAGVLAGALIAVFLRLTQVLPSTNMVPHVLVAATLILALLTMIDESDRTS